ncbi:hypothetical protein ABZ297_26690 [Nonomuraea sp. NPDC005983]|uniref:hypothetical protein n=1 Tax=Nonomuraea sp. NPDC005983 TaxID=3155595 RepID=UPI0033ABA29E
MLVERRTSVTGAEQRRLLTAFVAAARSGDLTALEQRMMNPAKLTAVSTGHDSPQATHGP